MNEKPQKGQEAERGGGTTKSGKGKSWPKRGKLSGRGIASNWEKAIGGGKILGNRGAAQSAKRGEEKGCYAIAWVGRVEVSSGTKQEKLPVKPK